MKRIKTHESEGNPKRPTIPSVLVVVQFDAETAERPKNWTGYPYEHALGTRYKAANAIWEYPTSSLAQRHLRKLFALRPRLEHWHVELVQVISKGRNLMTLDAQGVVVPNTYVHRYSRS